MIDMHYWKIRLSIRLQKIFHMNNSSSSIYKDLIALNLTSDLTSEVFNKGTRDNEDLIVYKDKLSNIIYIKDFYVGENEYLEGNYRNEKSKEKKSIPKANLGRIDDLNRRVKSFERFYIDKDIIDFGCGHGDFLIQTNNLTKNSIGIELQEDLCDGINSLGISCFQNINQIKDGSIDSIFLFHVFEHIHEPRKLLRSLNKKLKFGGRLIIEVPHAGDFLISFLKEESFIKFTLWSQHLILHTHQSLKVFLNDSEFSDILTTGIQRYPLSNHLNWIKNKKPGGHETNLALIENPQLAEIYESRLASINATDTLVAIATKK